MRLGLFGGAFDPPHVGHVALVRAAKEALGLDRGTLWQLETGGAMCDGGPTLALAAKLAAGRVVALEVVRVPACG